MKITAEEFAGALQRPVICAMPCGRCGSRSSRCSSCCSPSPTCTTKNAGYPIGGSLPMSLALEKRYLEPGRRDPLRHSRVEKILVEGDRAVGVRLADGSEHRARPGDLGCGWPHHHFQDAGWQVRRRKDARALREMAHLPAAAVSWALGVNRTFADEPKTVSGFSFPLREPREIGDAVQTGCRCTSSTRTPPWRRRARPAWW